MKKIPLTRGQEAIVDDWWYEYLSQWKWNASWNATTSSFYAVRTSPDKKCIRMHRVVAKTPDGMICDHVHHNTLDNREEELRNVTPSQSSMNRRVRWDSKTGIVGIRKQKDCIGYRVQLRCKGKTVLNKVYSTLETAIEARSRAENEYFGEYANHE